MYSLGNIGAVGAVALFASFAGVGVGDQFSSENIRKPAIKINKLVIRSDGSTVYDRSILTGAVWQAWSGVIYKENGDIHCDGGDLARYTGPLPDPAAHDVDWLVAEGCLDGLKEGMKWYFTWTPMGPEFATVRYPAKGYGSVIGPEVPPQFGGVNSKYRGSKNDG